MGVVISINTGDNRNLSILKILMIQIPALLQVYEANAGAIATQKSPGVSSVDTDRCYILIVLPFIAHIVFGVNLWRRIGSYHIGGFDVIKFSQSFDQFVSIYSRRRFDLEPGREVCQFQLVFWIISPCAGN